DVIFSPNHQLDPHRRIVDDHREVVRRQPARSDEHEVTDHEARHRDLTPHDVAERDVARARRHGKADGRRLAPRDARRRLRRVDPAASSAIARGRALPQRLLARAFELGRRTEAVVGLSALEQRPRRARIEVDALALPVRPERAADVGPLVPGQSQPAQFGQHRLGQGVARTFAIGILDAEHERSLVTPRDEPVEQRGPRVADVQLAGRTGSEADTHGYAPVTRTTVATAWAAIASPRPTASTPSFVLPLTLTADTSSPRTSATRWRIAGRCGTSFGRSSTTVTSALAGRHPPAARIATERLSRSSPATSFHCGSVFGKCCPMSPRPVAPNSASASAWQTTSPSECPSGPRSDGSRSPARTSGRPSTSRCRS